MSEQTSNAVAIGDLFDKDTLTAIQTMEQAVNLAKLEHLPEEVAADYGTGFHVVDKATLLGISLFIIQWRFSMGERGPMVSAEAVTKHNEKVVIVDGSTGIRDQLIEVTRKRQEREYARPQAGLMVPNGLTVSHYWTNGDKTLKVKPDGAGAEWTEGKTYYLAQ